MKLNYILGALMILMSLCVSGCGDRSTSWCAGKWEGEDLNHCNPDIANNFSIKINSDGTCKVSERFSIFDRFEDRYKEYDTKWEKVSDEIIKIYDDERFIKLDFDSDSYHGDCPITRWSMYLRKDGAYAQKKEDLDNPIAKLTKITKESTPAPLSKKDARLLITKAVNLEDNAFSNDYKSQVDFEKAKNIPYRVGNDEIGYDFMEGILQGIGAYGRTAWFVWFPENINVTIDSVLINDTFKAAAVDFWYLDKSINQGEQQPNSDGDCAELVYEDKEQEQTRYSARAELVYEDGKWKIDDFFYTEDDAGRKENQGTGLMYALQDISHGELEQWIRSTFSEPEMSKYMKKVQDFKEKHNL